jgi:hypothetical protein
MTIKHTKIHTYTVNAFLGGAIIHRAPDNPKTPLNANSREIGSDRIGSDLLLPPCRMSPPAAR